jgi:cytochrome P450
MTEDSRPPSFDVTPAKIEGHWLTGSLLAFVHRPLEFYAECARHGDIAIGRLGTIPIWVLSNPRDIEQVLVRDAESYEQTRLLRVLLKPLLGEGLLIAGKKSHARQRPLVEKAVHAGITAAWVEEVVDAAERFAASWAKGEPRDLYPEMLRVASGVLAGVVFGAGPHAAEASAAVDRAVDLATNRMQQFPPIPEFVPTRGNLEVRKGLREMDRALFAAILEKRAVPGTKSRLLSALVAVRGEGSAQLSDSEIRDQIVMIYVAVRHNMAAALTWTFYLLSQSKESYAKVLREVESVVGSGRPGMADAERLVYSERVVKESLRLYPPVWQILRHAARDTQIAGHKIRTGTQVLMSQWVLQRDARFFEEAEKFLPERWANPHEEWKVSYFPFGAGPRACFGERLSFLTVKLVLAVLARKFRLHLVPGQVVKPLPAFALRPSGSALMEARNWAEDLRRD